MKTRTKLTLGALALGVFAIGLTACTASFCTVADKSQVMYAYDVYQIEDPTTKKSTGQYTFGVSSYFDATATNIPEGSIPLEVGGVEFPGIMVHHDIEYNKALAAINTNIEKQGIFNGFVKETNSEGKEVTKNIYEKFWIELDNYFLLKAYNTARADGHTFYEADKMVARPEQKVNGEDVKVKNNIMSLLIGYNDKEHKDEAIKGYGYLKYAGKKDANDKDDTYYYNWDFAYNAIRNKIGVDYCPGNDYVTFFKKMMTQFVQTANSCLASTDGFYGFYGIDNKYKTEVFIEAKNWSDAWSRGFFEGLLVYPIGWLIDATTNAFMGAGSGVAQVLAIIVITFLIRALMMVFTINQTAQTAKMSELQPEIMKIQQKYPNANTNQSEQQSLAMETQQLYKKNKVHPFLSILVMILQFPIFICVWGAMTGSAVLASDEFLGLRLSDSVQSMLFNVEGWPNNPGWWTAIVIFILMAGLQVVSMLLPQMIQKKKLKKLAKTGRNPAMQKQNNTMKWVSIIMIVMVIVMGFSLASGMVIYWIAGSIWTICQTLIVEAINNHKAKNKGKPKHKKPAKFAATGANGNTVIDAEVIPEAIQAPTGKKKYKKGSN